MLRIVRVKGQSMSPQYNCGDFLVLATRFKIKVGQCIVFVHPNYDLMVKQVVSIQPIRVKGINIQSVTEEEMGNIELGWIRGKVIFHIKKGLND